MQWSKVWQDCIARINDSLKIITHTDTAIAHIHTHIYALDTFLIQSLHYLTLPISHVLHMGGFCTPILYFDKNFPSIVMSVYILLAYKSLYHVVCSSVINI